MAVIVEELEENPDAFIGYSETTGAAYQLAGGKGKPQSTEQADVDESFASEVAYWGKANDFPDQIEKHIESNPDLANVLQFKALKLYSYGLTYKAQVEDEEGNAKYIDLIIPEIEEFLKRNRPAFLKMCIEFTRFYNVFPELVLSLDRSKIRYIDCKITKEGRYEVMDKVLGYSKNLYLNPNWATGGTVKDTKTVKIPILNPIYFPPDLLKERTDSLNYIFPISFPTGKKYYQLATWVSIITSKWLELANSIPAFKLALMNNQVTLKYHIQMPDYWMEWKYPKFKSLPKEEQTKLTKAEIDKFDKFLVGLEKTGKSITSIFKTDPATGKEYPGWRITPIDDKLKDGKYIEDAQEATTKIYSANGVDPALGGFTPGTSGANRNGSDKREAGNELYTSIYAFEELLMQFFEYISDFNGWDQLALNKLKSKGYTYASLVWGSVKAHQQTLNQVSPSEREATHDPIQD
ncbi:hypothetical protein PBT90_16755 [Algoriphagus halophytocola]|uniref:hypothetical protein n=1 Tax=Algoriphagus halophytocola TaxID=2991499 RepID=UPI0022DDA605|nr:hypothetical protein [Algoriphagus sp. TR-M9]WBL42388.1 hypothetical protein PBT90_16755 [Algoriphagus sp. TR-M9]